MQQLIRDISASMSRNASATTMLLHLCLFCKYITLLDMPRNTELRQTTRHGCLPSLLGDRDKILKSFLLAIHGHLNNFALRFLFLQNHATSYSFFSLLLYTVKEIEGKPDRKAYPLPYGLKNSREKPQV